MKEQEEYFNYIWVCSEIGKIKREIKENERLLAFLEKNKLMFELKKEKDLRKERKKRK